MKIPFLLMLTVRRSAQPAPVFDGTIIFPASGWQRIPPTPAYPWVNTVWLPETLPQGTRIIFVSGPAELNGITLNLPVGVSPLDTIPYNDLASGSTLMLQNEQSTNCQLRSANGTTSAAPSSTDIVLGYILT